MTIKQQWLAVLGVVSLLGIGLWFGSRTIKDEFYEVRIGSEAPGFNAVDVMRSDAELKTLSDYRGKVVLLNIWATWCGPCKVEMPSIQALHEAYKDRGLAVVAVSVDDPGKEQVIRDFVKEYKLTFDVLYDRTELFRSVYRYTGVPETYLIDRDGVVRRKWIGPDDWNSPANRRFVEKLLGVTSPPAETPLNDAARTTPVP
ncbi:MAG: TlpA family protein disulfide reductase [Gemmatimonadaceae bacterium]|jgi:peroxiredoxin|nr:TlpA family protein disulfide reductase [Gemmatimonadaceae bacterium]